MHGSTAASTIRTTRAALFCTCLLLAAVVSARPQASAKGDGAKKEALSGRVTTPSADDRQKAMQADLDRLLQLARQLKVEVDATRRDELSVKVVRDADEIDKLARSTRGRIR